MKIFIIILSLVFGLASALLVGSAQESKGKADSTSKTIAAVLDEIKQFPPTKKTTSKAAEKAARPNFQKAENYADDGFNPFTADNDALNRMKAKFPVRTAVFEIATRLKKFENLPIRDFMAGPLDAKAKSKFLLEQKGPAIAILSLQEALDEANVVAEKRKEEPSKRWQAHFDFALARLQSRLVYLGEYENLLAQVRSDSLPKLEADQIGWRVTAVEKPQIREAAMKSLAKQAQKSWEHIEREYPDTPWAAIASQEKSAPLGLHWEAIKK